MSTCECGCGQASPIASQTDKRRGWVKGQPIRFVRGHATRGRDLPKKNAEPIVDATGCWIWPLATTKAGYGVTWRDGKLRYAHRVAFAKVHGEIPNGLTIDHLCRNTRCVNPGHMELVTLAENIRREMEARVRSI